MPRNKIQAALEPAKTSEEDFINSIDCSFPYDNEIKWKSLIQVSLRISQNASYMVLHEICRKPKSIKLDKSSQLKILSSWETANNDSLKELVMDSAKALINGINLPVSKVLKRLEKVSKFKNQFCALSIIYFSCDDKKGVVDEEYEKILKSWNA